MLPIRPETLKGHVDALLLAVLEKGPRHGYAIIESVRNGSEGAFDLPTGTLYPALHRLERAGFICSEWQAIGGRRRRVYELTSSGRQSLITERIAWVKFSDTLSTLLGRKA